MIEILVYIFIVFLIIIFIAELFGIEDIAWLFEWIVFFVFCVPLTVSFFRRWNGSLKSVWPPERNALAKRVFGALPYAVAVIIFFTLKELASWDVVESITYVVYYIVMGYAVVYIGLKYMSKSLDLYWDIDAIHNDNKAAVPAVAGGFLALTIIYSGANVGDGPGWWCVIFACGLGYFAWFSLWKIFHKYTDILERVTIGRDVCCGIRLCCYFIATGIVLGRASAGDWSGFIMTIVEFFYGWPVLPLMALMFVVERYIFTEETDEVRPHLLSSTAYGVFFIAAAVFTVLFVIAPLPENSEYDNKPNDNASYDREPSCEITTHDLEQSGIIDIEARAFDSLIALPCDVRGDAIRNYLTTNGLIREGVDIKFPWEDQP